MMSEVVQLPLRERLACDGEAPRASVPAEVWAQLERIGVPLSAGDDPVRVSRSDLDWLRAEPLERALRDDGPLPVRDVHLAFCVDSTNTRALAAPIPEPGWCDVWIADHQTAGRGRRDARWQSPFASGLCMTLATSLPLREDFAALPLVLGLAARRALAPFGLDDLAVKWPNDLLIGARKLGGILVESRHMAGQDPVFAMGLGLNVHAVPDRVSEDALAPVSLRDVLADGTPTRHAVVVAVLRHWRAAIHTFCVEGFGAFAKEWTRADCLYGRRIDVGDDVVLSGIARGVDATGQLRLVTESGEQVVPCGAIRIRPADTTGREVGQHG
ncbi:MAG: biotin--[acetyl-CoA-carboxylase] ligase [Pseudomonadota bacterium]